MSKERGTLLEKRIDGELTVYLTIVGGFFDWTADKDKALRLARRVDGDKLAEIVEDTQAVREHIFE